MTLQSRISVMCLAVAFGSALLAGCSGRPSLVPNSDKQLRRSSSQFAADAAKRQPYKTDATRGGEAPARAQVGYMLDRIEIVNLSDEDWSDVEVWVNQAYVVYVPTMEKDKLKVLNFQMIYDEQGNYFPTNNVRVNKVELLHDGKIYDVRVALAD